MKKFFDKTTKGAAVASIIVGAIGTVLCAVAEAAAAMGTIGARVGLAETNNTK